MSKPLGKVRRRVQDLRTPSFSYHDFLASGPKLDLSHNESARLAADCLLSWGLEEYHEVLKAEGEVDFLSKLEKNYILENRKDGKTDDCGASDNDDEERKSVSSGSHFPTSHALSTGSDRTMTGMEQSLEDVKLSDPTLTESSTEIFFQSDSRAAGMKDLVRRFIRKAKLALAIVMNTFSDVELLCDLLEASKKRNVSVHLLLDHFNLNLFVSMWQDLKLNSKNFPKLSVRSVHGQTYCAKTGRKLTGQIVESFIITDWTEVLTGSYSFSWLSWQVHRSLAVLFKGTSVTPFHQEFHRLYSSSKPVDGFVTFITVPHTLSPHSTSHAAQSNNTCIRRKKSNQPKTMCQWAWNENAESSQAKAAATILCNQQSPELEKDNDRPVHRAGREPPQLHPKPLVQPGADCRVQTVFVGKPTVGAACSQLEARVDPLEKNNVHSHAKPLDQLHFSYVKSPLAGIAVTTMAEKNARVQESTPLVSLTHGQPRMVRYQSTLKKNTNLDHQHVDTEGLFFQQSRDILAKPLVMATGRNIHREPRDFSLNFKPKVELLSELLSPPASQQKQAKTGLQLHFTHPRGLAPGLQTKISLPENRRQDQAPSHRHAPPQPPPNTQSPGLKPASTGMPTHHQTDPKVLLASTGAKLHLQHHPSQQTNPPPRTNWIPQNNHAARPRIITRQSSLSTTRGTGQMTGGQLGWRPFQSNMNASLGRSKSMTERRTLGIRGADHNPNKTST